MSPAVTARERVRRLLVVAVCALGLGGGLVWAAFTSSTAAGPLPVSSLSLSPYAPAAVSASRITSTTCRVTWTASAAAGAPAGLVYDVSDGASTLATAVSGLTTDVTTSGQLTPVVRARLGNWTSSTSTTSGNSCAGLPGAPTGVTLTAGDGQLAVAWTAPASNGGAAITGYTATASPGSLTCGSAATGCTITGLTNGTTYTVTVTATNSAGTGPASGGATAIPYPAAVMSGSGLRLWLDGADTSTLFQTNGTTTPATTSGQPVMRWTDKSGQGAYASQGTASAAATLTTVNGKVAPSFDGSADWLGLNTAAALPSGTSTSTEFVVAASSEADPSSSSYRVAWGHGTNSAGQLRQVWKDAGVSASAADANNYTGFVTGRAWSGTPLVAVAQFDAATVRMWTAGSTTGSSASYAFSTGTAEARVGNKVGGGEFWHGPVPEVIVFNTTLTSTQRRQVEEYLARKWGSPITPSVPTGVVAAAGDGTAAVTWTPGWDGGSAITGFTATATDGTNTFTCTAAGASATGCSITGLTNGLTYTVTVTATNAVGTSPTSTSVSTIPYPAGVMTAGRMRLWLDGGSASSLFQDTAGTTPATGAGQSVGRWSDRSGQGGYAAQATGAARPTLTAVNGKLVPTFDGTSQYLALASTAPLPSGTSPSTEFVVAANTEPNPASSSYRQAWIHGASTTGQARSFYKDTLSATSKADTYAGGQTSGDPYTSSPLIAAGEFASGTVSFWTSGRTSASTASTAFSTSTTYAELGRTNTQGYFWQGPIPEVIVLNTTLTANERRQVEEYLSQKWGSVITPSAPTGVGASAGAGSAAVSWTVPAYNGGSAVTGYTATAAPSDGSASSTCTASGASATGCTVTGLVSGLSYTVTVTATNAVGSSLTSGSASVTPSGTTVPSRPQSLSLTPGNGSIAASWSAPASTGGSALTGYTVTASPSGSCTATPPATSCTITGLAAGTTYTVTVTATNAIGTGAASGSASATTLAPPGTPTGVTLTTGGGTSPTTVAVAWTAPSSNGGSAITGYTVSVSPAPSTACSPAGAATTCSFTGTAGTAYSVTVQAVNAIGASTATNGKGIVLLANPGYESGSLAGWTTASGSPGATSSQRYTGSWSAVLGPSAQINQTVTGLTPNTSYTFSIAHSKSGGSPTGYIGVSGIADAKSVQLNPGSGWAVGSVTFTTGAAETSATLTLLSLNNTTYYDEAVLRAN